MKDGNNQYAPLRGHPVLLEATAAYFKPSFGDELKQENIMITIGATEGLFIAIKAILNPGDVVVAFEPGYTCYRTQTEYAGGKYVTVPLHNTKEGGWIFKGVGRFDARYESHIHFLAPWTRSLPRSTNS